MTLFFNLAKELDAKNINEKSIYFSSGLTFCI